MEKAREFIRVHWKKTKEQRENADVAIHVRDFAEPRALIGEEGVIPIVAVRALAPVQFVEACRVFQHRQANFECLCVCVGGGAARVDAGENAGGEREPGAQVDMVLCGGGMRGSRVVVQPRRQREGVPLAWAPWDAFTRDSQVHAI